MEYFKVRAFDILGLSINLDNNTDYMSKVTYNGELGELQLTIFNKSYEIISTITMREDSVDSFDTAEDLLADLIYNRKGNEDELI